MLLKYFYDKRLAQASYLVGCAATGEALVVDPSRDIEQYLEVADAEGLKITHVTETHIHADYVSGSRELAAQTGAMLYLSDMGDENWKYGFVDDHTILVRDGDIWMVGNIKVEVLYTPGHTPEHISFVITDTAGADKPMGIFTGDFLFVGDVGRPDLLEEAAGLVGTKEVGARDQFKSVERIKQYPDYLQVWPAHGAGSACGKALGAIPSSTLGYEKLFNPAFQFDNEDDFVAWLLDGQPEAPRYFARMKHVNKVGPALLDNVPTPEKRDRAELDQLLAENALVFDFREADDFAQEYVPGTVNIPASNSGFINYVGWFVDYTAPMYFIAPSEDAVAGIMEALQSIGVDNVPAYFTSEVVTGATETLNRLSVADLKDTLANFTVIDVRGATEYEEKHISGSQHIPLGYLPKQLETLPKDRPLVTHCASGYRSQIAASLLRKYGFENVANLNEDINVWSAALATE